MLRFRQGRKPEESVTGKIINVTYSYSADHGRHHTIIAVEAQDGQVYRGIKPGYDTSLAEGWRVEMGLRRRKILGYPSISSLHPVEPVNADESPTPYVSTDRRMAISRLRGLVGRPIEVRYVAGINGAETAHNEIATLMGSGILSAGEGDNLYIGDSEGFHAIPVSGIRSIKSGTTRIYENPQIDSKTGNNIFSAASEAGVDVVIGGLEIAGGIKTNGSSVRKQPIWGVPSQSVLELFLRHLEPYGIEGDVSGIFLNGDDDFVSDPAIGKLLSGQVRRMSGWYCHFTGKGAEQVPDLLLEQLA